MNEQKTGCTRYSSSIAHEKSTGDCRVDFHFGVRRSGTEAYRVGRGQHDDTRCNMPRRLPFLGDH
jgi:hypothetical protein